MRRLHAALLFVALVLVAATTSVAASEALSFASFSLYDFVGGLWHAHTVHDSSAAGRAAAAAKKAAAAAADAKTKSDKSAASSWLPGGFGFGTETAGLVSNLANAFSPDFTITCQVDGKPNFLRSATLYGLPADVGVDLGSGNSNAIDCGVNVNKGRGQTLARLQADEHAVDMRLLVVPLSRTRASLFLVSRLGSLPRQMKQYVAEAFGTAKKGDSNAQKAAFEQAVNVGADAPSAAVDDSAVPLLVGGLHPDSFVVTHRASLDVDFQNLNPLSGASAQQVEQAAKGSVTATAQAKTFAFSQLSVAFEPMNAKAKAALDAAASDTDAPACRIIPTRAAAFLTTQTDIILNVALRYVGTNCSVDDNGAVSNAVQQDEVEEIQGEDGAKKAPAKSKQQDEQKPTSWWSDREVFVHLNAKRFADIGDEEVDMGYDTPWYQKRRWGPTIGAICLLIVIVGGRRGMNWFLKKKGYDVERLLKSTRNKTKEEIQRLRRERLAAKGGPMTDEEVSRLQEEEDRQMMADLQKSDK